MRGFSRKPSGVRVAPREIVEEHPITATNTITRRIIGCTIRVHRVFGPGLLESPYKLATAIEFTSDGLSYVAEAPLPVSYNGRELGTAYRMDFVVEESVVVEVKATERILPIHRQQLLTYLRLSGYPVGLLINFNVPVLKDGIVRVVNDRPKTSS